MWNEVELDAGGELSSINTLSPRRVLWSLTKPLL
jgi:hypothetical protein